MPHSKSDRVPLQTYQCALCYEPMEITHKIEFLGGKRYRRWECRSCARSHPIKLPAGSYYFEPW
jgi:hypothetical protein